MPLTFAALELAWHWAAVPVSPFSSLLFYYILMEGAPAARVEKCGELRGWSIDNLGDYGGGHVIEGNNWSYIVTTANLSGHGANSVLTGEDRSWTLAVTNLGRASGGFIATGGQGGRRINASNLDNYDGSGGRRMTASNLNNPDGLNDHKGESRS